MSMHYRLAHLYSYRCNVTGCRARTPEFETPEEVTAWCRRLGWALAERTDGPSYCPTHGAQEELHA